METSTTPAAPNRFLMLRESRIVLDLARMWGPLAASKLLPTPSRQTSPILVVPGFDADDHSTLPLRTYLKNRGFRVEGWGLGRNLGGLDLPHEQDDLSDRWDFEPREDYQGEGGVPLLCDRLIDHVSRRSKELESPLTLIGWSLGGYLAREAARDLPDQVDRVITMGSPVVGGPKYTAAAKVFRQRGMDLDWIESEVARRDARPIQQPVTAIVSKSDAIVGWTAAIDHQNEQVRHIHVDAAHLGMGFDPTIWRVIVGELEPVGTGVA